MSDMSLMTLGKRKFPTNWQLAIGPSGNKYGGDISRNKDCMVNIEESDASQWPMPTLIRRQFVLVYRLRRPLEIPTRFSHIILGIPDVSEPHNRSLIRTDRPGACLDNLRWTGAAVFGGPEEWRKAQVPGLTHLAHRTTHHTNYVAVSVELSISLCWH